MSVTQVKSAMDKLNAEFQSTLNSLDNLITILIGVDDSTSNLVASPSSRLKANLSVLKSNIEYLYNMTRVELHIFFREYNESLSKTIVEIDILKTTLDVLISDSKFIYMMYLLDIGTGNFFKHDNMASDLKNNIPQLVMFRETLIKLQSDTTINNSKLIIKNNRG